jgi:hydroxyacylglutathione hydrolase
MVVHNLKTGDWGQNCFIIANSENRALIIDPGDNFEDIVTFLSEHKITPIAIVNTHGHFDHIGAIAPLKEKYSIGLYIHEKELSLIKRGNLYKAAFVGKSNIQIPTIDFPLNDETKTLDVEHFHLVIHQTPGHTNGGICIQLGNWLFTGDTLLSSNLLPKRLPEENPKLLMQTFEYLDTLDPSIIIYPGHGKPCELGPQVKHLLQHWKKNEL